MSESNRSLVADKYASRVYKKKLKSITSSFFRFLERTPKPSDEAVRTEFKKRELDWKAYCIQHNLDIRTSLLFNAKVSYEWEIRKKANNMQTRN